MFTDLKVGVDGRGKCKVETSAFLSAASEDVK